MDYSSYVINVMKPDNTLTTFAFMGDTLISSQEFESKRDSYLSKLKQHLTVSKIFGIITVALILKMYL